MSVTTSAASPDAGEDLAPTLRYIGKDKLARTRAKLANSPQTRKFLELGLALLRADLIEHTGPDFEQGVRSRLFESLSRERIMTLAEARDPSHTLPLGVNMFRERWSRKDFYTEDLIAYLFRLGPQERRMEEMAEAGRALTKEASLGQLVRALAAAEVQEISADPLYALQGVVQAALPKHPRVQEFCRNQYDYLLPRWGQLYEEVAKAYGLALTAKHTWLDVALLFNSVVEGAIFRSRVEGEEPTLSNGDGVLAGAIFAMLPTLLTNCPNDWDSCFPIDIAKPRSISATD